jgi:hypothetical protein
MINELKKETHKLVSGLIKDINKQKELKENSSKQMNEI